MLNHSITCIVLPVSTDITLVTLQLLVYYTNFNSVNGLKFALRSYTFPGLILLLGWALRNENRDQSSSM